MAHLQMNPSIAIITIINLNLQARRYSKNRSSSIHDGQQPTETRSTVPRQRDWSHDLQIQQLTHIYQTK